MCKSRDQGNTPVTKAVIGLCREVLLCFPYEFCIEVSDSFGDYKQLVDHSNVSCDWLRGYTQLGDRFNVACYWLKRLNSLLSFLTLIT